MIGTTIGHFRVLDRLGRGGMGDVLLAEDLALHRRVALKRLAHTLSAGPHWVARLRREAIALAAVNHPNVVTIYGVEEADGVPLVVMELVEGHTLQQALPPTGFDLGPLLDYALAVAAALEAAHAKGVLHRDLKPSNVMVTEDGRIKVVDFGLAKLLEFSDQEGVLTAGETTAGLLVGTPVYMAPEQLVGEPADRKSDLYSFGVLLFEMATGRPPFAGTTIPQLMQQVLLEDPPTVSSHRPDVPDRLSRLVAGLLAKDPPGRPATARLVVEELERCRRGDPVGPSQATRPAAAGALAAKPTDLGVAQLLVKGRHLWNRRTEASLRSAIRCFQEVIDRDPTQPKAWIGIADALNMLSNYGFAPPGDTALRVRAAVERAVEIEGVTPDALRALALAAWQFDFAWSNAESLYRQALEADPGNGTTHHWYAVLLGVTGRFDESLAEFARAEALDPLSLISLASRGWFNLFAGRLEEAHAIERRVLSIDGDYFPAWWFDGKVLSAMGRHAEAIAALGRAIELGGRTPRMLAYLGFAVSQGGDRTGAEALLAELESRSQDNYVPPYFRAIILAGLRRDDEALGQLELAQRSRDTMLRDLAIDLPWWPYRGEPRYHALLVAMGLRPASTAPSS